LARAGSFFVAPWTIFAPLFAAGSLACGGAGNAGRPVASVASSTEAAAAFEPIEAAWSTDAKERMAMRAALEAFLGRFPSDGLAPLVRTYLAMVELDGRNLGAAEADLALLSTLAPGATKDLAEIARAEDMRLRGHPDLAFDRLRPLVGKVVDPISRAILQEEVSLAAIEAKRDYEAIAYMDSWLRNAAEEDHDAVRAKVKDALASEPETVLMNALRAMRSGGPASGYGREIQLLVTAQLAQVALSRNDSDLARWLVSADSAAPLLGDAEGALGELATTKRGLATVDGRTIGLVLPTGSTDMRDEAASIMRGAAWALDLPRADASKGDRTKLITRDDGGDANRVEPTMSELAGEGAVVILAALDPVSAERAAKWGETHGVAVITFAVPKDTQTHEWSFSIGVTRDEEIATLAEELVSRAVVKLVPIVPPNGATADKIASQAIASLAKGSMQIEPSVACDTAAAQSGEASFPVDDWKKEKARAWLVDAPSECARDLVRQLAIAQLQGIVALTLDAAGSSARAPSLRMIAVRAGEIPITAATPAAIADADVRAWTENAGAPPNWWAALGHDAAVLARRAVAALPLDATSDGAEVTKRRAAAKAALAKASAHLWTTESDGFATARLLPRTLGVADLPSTEPRDH
jgi:hypothetical protein